MLVTYDRICDVPPTPVCPLMTTILAKNLGLWKTTFFDKENRPLTITKVRLALHAEDHATWTDL